MPTATIPIVFATSFVVGFSGAIAPGPLLVYSIRESIRRGFMAGPLIVAGHALLELVVVVGLVVGVARFLDNGLASFAIALVGGLFLLWMGWGMVTNPSKHVLSEASHGSERVIDASQPARPILGGALVSISNPFWTLWWATIGLTYVLWAASAGVAGLASFYVGHILSDLAWYSLVAFGVASGRRIMTQGMYKGLIAACGLFLLGLGVFFVSSSAGFLRGFLGY